MAKPFLLILIFFICVNSHANTLITKRYQVSRTSYLQFDIPDNWGITDKLSKDYYLPNIKFHPKSDLKFLININILPLSGKDSALKRFNKIPYHNNEIKSAAGKHAYFFYKSFVNSNYDEFNLNNYKYTYIGYMSLKGFFIEYTIKTRELNKTIFDDFLVSIKNMEKVHRKKYSDGTFYIGGLMNDKPHGQGYIEWAGGGNYDGEWSNGKKNGRGKIIWSNKRSYDGDWVNDIRDGMGTYTWKDGTYYKGEFVNNAQTGKGLMLWPNGTSYEGDFIDGKRHGEGIMKWPNGNHYEGAWISNDKSGIGKFTWADKQWYTGNFYKNKFNGQGVIELPGINPGYYQAALFNQCTWRYWKLESEFHQDEPFGTAVVHINKDKSFPVKCENNVCTGCDPADSFQEKLSGSINKIIYDLKIFLLKNIFI